MAIGLCLFLLWLSAALGAAMGFFLCAALHLNHRGAR